MANKPTPADFSPTVPDFPSIGQYQPIYGKFDLTTYIQGASDYEIMAFLVQCYNATLKGYSDVTQLSKDTVTAYNQLQTWVNTWFAELDVQQEINNKLQAMYEAGTLATAIAQSNTIPTAVSQYLNSTEGTQNLSNVTAQKIEAMEASGALGTVINNTGTVQSITTNWLQQNVTPTGSAVIVDKSLSVEGAAADSKATGNSINSLKSDLNKSLDGIINRNIILRDNEKHEFPLPKGTEVKLETLDGSNFEITPDSWRFFRLYGSDGSELSRFGATEGTSQRTLSVDVDGVTKIGLYEKHTVPIYVSVLSENSHKKYPIDNYLNEEYMQTFSEINEKKTEDSITIGIMTDLHFSSRGSGYNEQLLRDGVILSMKALSNMTRDAKHDVVSFLGDYEQFPIDRNMQAKQMGFDNLLEINYFLSKMNCKSIAIQGNHERLYSGIEDSYGMTDDEFFRYCTEQFVYKNGFITDGIHCYYDDVKSKLRYIFLNSTTNSIDASVVEFLKRASDTTYDVVVLSHFGGESGTIYDSTKKYINTLKENGANVILWLSGHCHQDWHYEYNGCLIISFLQSGYWSSEVSENGVRYEHEVGNKNYCAFTTVLLNRTEKKVHCIRFGLGINYTYNLPNAN